MYLRRTRTNNDKASDRRSYETPNVHDRVGIVSLDPQYFDIIDFNRNTLLSSTYVYSRVFSMKERENPILMSPEGEVAHQDVSSLQQSSSTPILDEKYRDS